MYKSVFRVRGAVGTGMHLEVSLSVGSVMGLLPGHDKRTIAAQLGGEEVQCQLRWSPAINGYVVWYEAQPVGVILHDELLRASSVPIRLSEGAIACQFAIEFAGAYVWRAGLLNQGSGQAIVLTADETLSYLPASLWVPIAGENASNILGLAVGHVMDVFNLTQQQLQWLARYGGHQAAGFAPGDHIPGAEADELVALTEAGIEFATICTGYQKAP